MATKLQELNGKVALVTGGAMGIGRGCVEILAENGWKVALWDIDDAEGALVEKAYPGRVFYRHCDVTNEEQIKVGITNTVDSFGKLDCLVNNVGTQQEYHTIDGYSTDDFRRLLEINLVSCFAMCKYALPHLRQSKGNIVNVSSIAVEHGNSQCVTYGASKAGVATLTKCLAIDEAKHGVRVNGLELDQTNFPWIGTPMAERLLKGIGSTLDGFDNFNVMGRCGDPREMGKACLYLATDATYCTGSILRATGGIDIGFGHKYN